MRLIRTDTLATAQVTNIGKRAMSFLRAAAAPLFAFLSLVVPSLSAPAAAAIQNVVVSGVFDGTWDGRAFTGERMVFSGRFDTDAVSEMFDETHMPLIQLDVATATDRYSLTEPTMFFLNPLESLAGFVDPDATRGLLRFDRDGAAWRFYTDDLTSAFASTGGALSLAGGSGITMSFAAVPEPATWALMILGFGATGAAMRRRPRRMLAASAR